MLTFPRLTILAFLGAGFLAAVPGATGAVQRPNIILVLADDLGFSDIGCYGSEIPTPNLDRLAREGVRFTQFYNGARCCPSRAILMTGLYPQQAHVGDMVDEYARRVRETLNTPAYSDRLNPHAPTIAEALREAGYRTGMSGKWHLGYRTNEWPSARGFDSSFAVIEGAMNYYGYGMQHTGVITNPPMALDREIFIPPREGFFATDAFTDHAVKFINQSASGSRPFFLYLAYTAPHWPLQARPETIAKYRGKYKEIGWDKLREQRLQRLKAAGIIDAEWALAPRPANVRDWNEVPPARRDEWDAEMSTYAAMIDELDQGIGRVLAALHRSSREENTVVMFMSDNGGAAENPNRSLPGAMPGTRESYKGYGIAGAHVSSGPFRKTKKYTHEGGIATPLIVRWPVGMKSEVQGSLVRDIGHFVDIMPTCLDLGGARFPRGWGGERTIRPEGISLVPAFSQKHLSRRTAVFWEHEGHRAARDGKWKLVASFDEPWELYDMEQDRTELNNLADAEPRRTRKMIEQYEVWAKRVGVKPWPGLNAPPGKKSASPPTTNTKS